MRRRLWDTYGKIKTPKTPTAADLMPNRRMLIPQVPGARLRNLMAWITGFLIAAVEADRIDTVEDKRRMWLTVQSKTKQ